MGYQTTVVVRNDALDSIAGDPAFGKKLALAVQHQFGGKPLDVAVGNHGNAVMVIEQHHDSEVHGVLMGKGIGIDMGSAGGVLDWGSMDGREAILKRLAQSAGFDVVLTPRADKHNFVRPEDMAKALAKPKGHTPGR